MIKVRVDWHHECPGCGTEVVSDYFDESAERLVCPWCGCGVDLCQDESDSKTREYLRKAIKRIEEKANSSTVIKA